MKPEYHTQPVRVRYKTKRGNVSRNGSYSLIEKMRKADRLIGAWSNSTGKPIT